MCLVLFEIFASSVHNYYFLVFCVTLWQPAVFHSVPYCISEHTVSSNQQK
jgi:hypothetical protein